MNSEVTLTDESSNPPPGQYGLENRMHLPHSCSNPERYYQHHDFIATGNTQQNCQLNTTQSDGGTPGMGSGRIPIETLTESWPTRPREGGNRIIPQATDDEQTLAVSYSESQMSVPVFQSS